MIKIVLGTRPEIIKLYPIIKKLEEDNVDYKILFTNQHFSKNMSELFFDFFKINKKKLISNKAFFGKSDESLKFLCENIEKKDIVVVQGDTRSAYEGAIVSKIKNAKLHQVEAGLRTGDFNSPYPEEFYRKEISRMADVHYAPTKIAMDNLAKEGIKDNVFLTGNPVVQSLKFVTKDVLFEETKTVVVTIHRGENKKCIRNIVSNLIKIFNTMSEYTFKVVVHPNNIFMDAVRDFKLPSNVELLKPLGYKDFICLVANAKGVITDSGGLQEECCFLNIPCCVFRNNTERPESINVGVSKLFNPFEDIMHMNIVNFIKYYSNYKMTDEFNNPYYNEDCIEDIAKVLK